MLTEYNLFDYLAQIFNFDETGLLLEHTPPCVVSIKGQKHPAAGWTTKCSTTRLPEQLLRPAFVCRIFYTDLDLHLLSEIYSNFHLEDETRMQGAVHV